MSRSFRFVNRLLFIALIPLATTTMATAQAGGVRQQAAATSQVQGILTGSRVAVFTTPEESCEQMDIPDAPARAFRDYRGTVHLFSASTVLHASLGPTLETVQHSCDAAYWSKLDANPADFDDRTWLDSFYSIDGTQVVGLGHMEYHGWAHPGECAEQGNYTAACWYNGDTFHVSNDGGYHFGSFEPPANYVLSVPYPYIVNTGPEGYSIDTNIVQAGDWYYAMVTGWSWPANCFDASNCFVFGGGSPIRASNILEPTTWRGWDGQDFSVTFVDPYLGPIPDRFDHIFTPIPAVAYVNAINFHAASNLFVATLFDPYNDYYGPPGLYLSTSSDMINWGEPILVVTVAQLLAKEPPGGSWSYAYFSLLDPDSTDLNFSTIGDTPYLYYVRSNGCCYTRVLFRQPLQLVWSEMNQSKWSQASNQ